MGSPAIDWAAGAVLRRLGMVLMLQMQHRVADVQLSLLQ